MKVKVFVLIHGEDVSVYPNLTQLLQDNSITPGISYFRAYRALQKNSRILIDDYTIVSTHIYWKTHRRLPTAFE